MWRITADRSGVYLRRMWSTRFIAWSVIGRVEIRRDGLLEFIGPQRAPVAGLFMPPWLARLLRRPGTGGLTADTLTAMARHSHLRPAAQDPRPAGGLAFVRWAVPSAVILYLGDGESARVTFAEAATHAQSSRCPSDVSPAPLG